MSDFAWKVHAGTGANRTPVVLKAVFNNGYVQRGSKGIRNSPRTIPWQIDDQTTTVLNAIDTFLVSKAGWQSFTWTPPEGGEMTVYCERWGWIYNTGLIVGISGEFMEK